MAEDDVTGTGARGTHRVRSGGAPPGAWQVVAREQPALTRSDLRRLARARQRRRWAAEGLAVLVCVTALMAYVNSKSSPGPADRAGSPGGVPAGVSRPSAVPDGALGTGAAMPGLRTRQQPPSPTPTPAPPPPPVPPVLTATRSDVPAEVDLSAVGTRDWVHFGLRAADSTVRKRDSPGEIRDEGGTGRRRHWDGNQEAFRWRDGAGVGPVDGTTGGVYACGAGNGFVLAVAGSGELRTVHLYAGIWMAKGRLDVQLSTGGPTQTLRMEDPHTSQSADFAIRFQAPPEARLVLTWTAEEVFTDDCGNVGIQAVALR